MDRLNNKKKLKDFIDSNIYKKQSRLILLQKKQIKSTDEEKKEMEKLDTELNILYQIEEICEERGRY